MKVNKKMEDLTFRIDCNSANDADHPNHPGNPDKARRKAVKLYYLQLQDSQTPSGTYANVVYPQMDSGMPNAPQ